MTNDAINQTVGSIAVSHPESVSVFTRHGLDFCCGGGRTLRQACAAKGLDPNAVLAEILAATNRVGDAAREDWHAFGMTELADHIERVHHVRARDLISRIDALLPRVLNAHGDAHQELRVVARIFDRFRSELIDHMIREERVLFPWLRRLEAPGAIHIGPPWSVARPISCMVHDHDDAAAALAGIRSAVFDYAIPPEACRSYAALITALRDLDEDTRIHIHKENNALFPAGIRAESERNARATEAATQQPSCGLRDPVHSGD